MKRRTFFGVVGAGLGSLLLSSCKGPKPDPPDPPDPPPQPVYVYVLGDYDNFDGEGCWQEYPTQKHLAVAGALSSEIWHGPGEVIDSSGITTKAYRILDENNQQVELGFVEAEIVKVIPYLKLRHEKTGRKLINDSYERKDIEMILNKEGKKLVTNIENENFDVQMKRILHMMDVRNRRKYLNEQGQNIAEFSKTQDWNKLRGVDSRTFNLALRLLQEKQEYDFYQKKQEKKEPEIVMGIGTSKKIMPIKHIYDANGKFIETEVMEPDEIYAPKVLKWVGAKNMSYHPERGIHDFVNPLESDVKTQELSDITIQQGVVYGRAEMVQLNQANHGYVCKMTRSEQGGNTLELINISKTGGQLTFKNYKSWSADVMLSSDSGCEDFSLGMDLHTSITEQGGGSWYTQIGIKKSKNGLRYVFANIKNVNTEYHIWERLEDIEEDKWYNIRMDIVTHDDDPNNLTQNKLRLDFYVNDVLKFSEIPEDSAILLDINKLGFKPSRALQVYIGHNEGGDAMGYFDNIKAVYRKQVAPTGQLQATES